MVKGRYWGRGDYLHDASPRVGVLLINLGTPAAPTPRAVRRYLAEFLNDPRVIELPAPLRRALVHGIVLRVRPRVSARAYREIWHHGQSPLLHFSRSLTEKLGAMLEERLPGPVSTALAMRYGEPRISSTLRELARGGVDRLLVLPLYPQYSGATTASAFDALAEALAHMRWIPSLRFVGSYHDDPGYIEAVAENIRAVWRERGRTDKMLFSFHGMPQATLAAGDPYHCQCRASARLVAAALALPPDEWSVAFQSRFGRAAWLGPATEATLIRWAGEGVKTVAVACPGFAVDCLETLEEVAIRYSKAFMVAGGERFEYVPALNDRAAHVDVLAGIVMREASGWPETLASYDAAEAAAAARRRAARARDASN